MPLPVYATAVVTALVPSVATPARWAAVAFGVADVLLLALLVSRCVSVPWAAIGAPLVLLVTPSHLLFSRTATRDGIWQLPFVLAWAIGLTALMEPPTPRARWTLAAGMAALAASTYAQPTSALMMPMFGVVTLGVYLRADGWRLRDAVPAAATFVTLLLPLLIWFARYPATYPDTFGRWVLHPAHLRNPIEWLQAVTNWGTASTVAAVFWDFLVPSHLFFTPAAPGLCGLFLTPLAVPIGLGAYHALRSSTPQNPARRMGPAIVACCLIGPLAAAMFGHARSDDRSLILVPFGLVVAAWGAQSLWQRGAAGRGLLVASMLVAVIQAAVILS